MHGKAFWFKKVKLTNQKRHRGKVNLDYGRSSNAIEKKGQQVSSLVSRLHSINPFGRVPVVLVSYKKNRYMLLGGGRVGD